MKFNYRVKYKTYYTITDSVEFTKPYADYSIPFIIIGHYESEKPIDDMVIYLNGIVRVCHKYGYMMHNINIVSILELVRLAKDKRKSSDFYSILDIIKHYLKTGIGNMTHPVLDTYKIPKLNIINKPSHYTMSYSINMEYYKNISYPVVNIGYKYSHNINPDILIYGDGEVVFLREFVTTNEIESIVEIVKVLKTWSQLEKDHYANLNWIIDSIGIEVSIRFPKKTIFKDSKYNKMDYVYNNMVILRPKCKLDSDRRAFNLNE
nr:MAG TPA: hypothetical protein [Caudoviricetes sp.]